jgi:EpsI family protein
MLRSASAYFAVLLTLGGLSLSPLQMPASSSIDSARDPRFESIPLEIGEWIGKDVSPGEDVYRILETKNILSRLYQNSKGETIDLLLVSSSKDRRVAHPPEVCYTSSHYTILDSRESKLMINGREIPVSEFTAQDQLKAEHLENVLYLYQVGEQFTNNYYAQQFQFAVDRLSRKESQVLLIRLSGSTREPFKEFLTQILAHVSPSNFK